MTLLKRSTCFGIADTSVRIKIIRFQPLTSPIFKLVSVADQATPPPPPPPKKKKCSRAKFSLVIPKFEKVEGHIAGCLSICPSICYVYLVRGISKSHISLVSFLWDIGKQCKTRSDASKAMSDQVHYCLLTEGSFRIKMKNTTNNLKIGNVLVQLIRWENTFGINGLNLVRCYVVKI